MNKIIGQAVFIKKLDWSGNAILYKLSTPAKYYSHYDEDENSAKTSYVVVSAIDKYHPILGNIKETFIFPATPDGKAINMVEMGGSLKDTTSHEEALNNAGYSLKSSDIVKTFI